MPFKEIVSALAGSTKAKVVTTVATCVALSIAILTFALRFRTGAYTNFASPFPDWAQLEGMSGRAVEMVAVTLRDLVDAVFAHWWLIPLLLFGVLALIWSRRGRKKNHAFASQTIRWWLFGAATTLVVLLVVLPGSIHDQLTEPVFPRLQRIPNPLNVEDVLNHSYEKLQVCARVGDHPNLYLGGITCDGPEDSREGNAHGQLRDIYAGFFALMIALAWLYWREALRVPAVSPESKRSTRPALLLKAMGIFCLLLIPWVYGTFRANVGIHGTIPKMKNCGAYLLEAGQDWIVIYQPFYPEAPHSLPLGRNDFKTDADASARSDAIAERLRWRLKDQAEALPARCTDKL